MVAIIQYAAREQNTIGISSMDLKREIEKSDVVVLAQASMAAALSDCEGLDMNKILTSPLRGILKLKKTVER